MWQASFLWPGLQVDTTLGLRKVVHIKDTEETLN